MRNIKYNIQQPTSQCTNDGLSYFPSLGYLYHANPPYLLLRNAIANACREEWPNILSDKLKRDAGSFQFLTLQTTTISLTEESTDKPAVGLICGMSYTLDRTVKCEFVLMLYRKSECSIDCAVCSSLACVKSYAKRRIHQSVCKCLVLINIQ